jgi:hypothetical protein
MEFQTDAADRVGVAVTVQTCLWDVLEFQPGHLLSWLIFFFLAFSRPPSKCQDSTFN